MEKHYIYAFKFPNGKYYIGRTNNFEDRLTSHKYCAKKGKGFPVHFAIRKHGWDNVEKTILLEVDSEEEASIKELEYIHKYDSFCNGYNATLKTDGGCDAWKGKKDTEAYKEFKKKISEVTAGERNGMYGRTHSEETRKKLSKKSKGRHTLEWFIDRYGNDEGQKKYKGRNTNIKNKRTGNQNPAYRSIGFEEFKKDVISGSLLKKEMCKKYNISLTCFDNKLKEAFGTSKLTDIRPRPKRVH